MPRIDCGFVDTPQLGAVDALALNGPSLLVDIGFDSNYGGPPNPPPVPAVKGVWALVDTGAQECCIDAELARTLNLPLIDRRTVSGSSGAHVVDVFLAQIHVPALGHTMYGAFSAVNLAAGGQIHKALMGRTFLRAFTMEYSGTTGGVAIFS